jgi:low temperature requirement protein LtrA
VAADRSSGAASPAGPGPPSADDDELPLRVSTLEIFFDLVFAFTLTQLTSVLASRVSWLAVGQVLLVFVLLWWMYGAYAWLTNARPPVHPTERLLLLVGMAGFLVVGLAIPRGFSNYGVVLGLGYLTVVLVHAVLYYRVNANILRVAPFNIASALLITVAGLLHGPSGAASVPAYLLWIGALVVQLGSPLVVHPAGLFALRPAHFSERHNALLIVAIGESVAAVGIGAAGPASQPGAVNSGLLASAVLGLAVAAALWWIVFGTGDEERAERALSEATTERRTGLALSAFFYGFIPLLLGLIAMAAGVLRSVTLAAELRAAALPLATRAGQAAIVAVGAALFLAGDVIIRTQLRTGPVRLRAVAAVVVLASIAVGIAAGLEAQLAVVTAVLIAPLIAERQPDPAGPAGPAGGGQARADAAG